MKLNKKYRMERHDLIAIIACIVLFSLFLIGIRFRIEYLDESGYLAVAQRFARGERPLVDEMHLSQLAFLFLVPFYSLFKAVTGGTEGIVLFMRQVFLLVDFTVYWILYRHLRSYRAWGVIATVLFCSYVPWSIFALNYYTMPIYFLMLFCVVLFLGKKEPSKGKLLLAGVLLSCAVVTQPPLAFLYVFYSVAVLAFEIKRKNQPDFGKNYSFFFNRRYWLYMTLSVAACAGVFLAFLGYRSGFKNIITSLPLLLSDPDYSVGKSVFKAFFTEKIPELIRLFGVFNCCSAAIILVAVFILFFVNKKDNKKREKYRCFLFFLSNLLFLLLFSYYSMFKNDRFLYAVRDGFNNSVFPFSLICFSCVNFFLTKQRERKMLLILVISVLSSFLMDLCSAKAIGFCGIIAAIPGVLCFKNVFEEFKKEKKMHQNQKRKNTVNLLRENTVGWDSNTYHRRQGLIAASLVVFYCFLIWKGFLIGFERYVQIHPDFNSIESRESTTTMLNQGPHKGMYTSLLNCNLYYETLRDMDLIRQETNGSVLLENYFPFAPLYLDLFSTNYCAWNTFEMRDRQLRYFALHPEKQPSVMGFLTYRYYSDEPYGEEWFNSLKEYVDFLCDGSITQGERGVIVKVEKWHYHSAEEVETWILQHSQSS